MMTSAVKMPRKPATTMARLYKCPVCDTVIEVLAPNGLELTCCGPQMQPLTQRVAKPSQPHHLVVERSGNAVTVRVGGSAHPMDDEHRIAWIEVSSGGISCRKFLSTGDSPEATFAVDSQDLVISAYCNAHGLWRSSVQQVERKPQEISPAAIGSGPVTSAA